MEMHLQFIYHENAGLEFFSGVMTMWVYVNNHLVIDQLYERLADTLFRQKENELGLVEVRYRWRFYAERNPVEQP